MLCAAACSFPQVQADLSRYVWDTPSPDVHSFAFRTKTFEVIPDHLNGWKLFDLQQDMSRMVRVGLAPLLGDGKG